jgi:hypothetical protein
MAGGGGTRSDEQTQRWEPSSHVSYREWATEALGDERQIYARSTTSSKRELVFLPDGAAESFREAARSGHLVCPVPGCPSPQLTTRGPVDRRHHFVHLQAPADAAHQRDYVRRVATELLVEWIEQVHPRSTVEADVDIGGLSVAARIEGPTGLRFAVMFVDRRLGLDAWLEADSALELLGFMRGWIFSPRQFLSYPQPSSDAGPGDPAAVDQRRGDIVLDSSRLSRDVSSRPVAAAHERDDPGTREPRTSGRRGRTPA